MATDNPTFTAASVITDVQSRLNNPNLSGDVYLPWLSYSVQKLHAKLTSVGQRAKEYLFGDREDIPLTADILEYTITDSIPRFGGVLRIEVRYGASGDDWSRATPLVSINNWDSLDNVSTTYRGKTNPLYYLRRNVIGIIPTPPAGESVQTPTARVWYVRRQPQINDSTDEIDIPYRFIYPVLNYVEAMAIRRLHEDYGEARDIENQFERELEQVALAVADEFEEGVEGIEISSSSELFYNPLD